MSKKFWALKKKITILHKSQIVRIRDSVCNLKRVLFSDKHLFFSVCGRPCPGLWGTRPPTPLSEHKWQAGVGRGRVECHPEAGALGSGPLYLPAGDWGSPKL